MLQMNVSNNEFQWDEWFLETTNIHCKKGL